MVRFSAIIRIANTLELENIVSKLSMQLSYVQLTSTPVRHMEECSG
jgi:hypothetical protein